MNPSNLFFFGVLLTVLVGAPSSLGQTFSSSPSGSILPTTSSLPTNSWSSTYSISTSSSLTTAASLSGTWTGSITGTETVSISTSSSWSTSTSISNSYSNTYSISTSNSYSISYSNSYSVSYSGSPLAGAALFVRNIKMATPTTRNSLDFTWDHPLGVFFPSYNIYITTDQQTTPIVITGVQAQEYLINFFDPKFINVPGVNWNIQIAGVNSNGVEAPKAPAFTFQRSVALPSDPKKNPTLGVVNIACGSNSDNVFACSWSVVGTNIYYKMIKIAVKCKRNGPGAPKRHFSKIFGKRGNTSPVTSILIPSIPHNSVCKVEFRTLYYGPVANSLPNDRRGQKTSLTVHTT